MKTCSRCGQEKALSEFRKDSRSRDGRRSECKACSYKYDKNYAGTEAGRARAKKYDQKPKRQAAKRQSVRNWLSRVKEFEWFGAYRRQKQKEYETTPKYKRAFAVRYQRDREKYRARHALNGAIRRGTIPHASSNTCQQCRQKKARHYHHNKGYAWENRFDVVPLCVECHFKIHGK